MSETGSKKANGILTVPEAATILRVSPGCVYGMCRAGLLKHERIGVKENSRGAIRIPRRAIREAFPHLFPSEASVSIS
jgi:hypothetical protein